MEIVSRDDRDAPEVLDGVHLAQLVAGDRMSLQHFRIEPDGVVHEHNHEHEQVGYLFSGSLTFIADGEEFTVEAGDSYAIPSEALHAVENRTDEPGIGIELFSPPRPDPPWAE